MIHMSPLDLLQGFAAFMGAAVYIAVLITAWRKGWVHGTVRMLVTIIRAVLAVPARVLAARSGPPVIEAPEPDPDADLPEILRATPKIWCTCDSTAEPEPVEVDYHDGKGPVVVATLCPGCREKRTPPTGVQAHFGMVRSANVFGLVPHDTPPGTIITGATFTAGQCVACGGRGERFGYGCDPCEGTGRSNSMLMDNPVALRNYAAYLLDEMRGMSASWGGLSGTGTYTITDDQRRQFEQKAAEVERIRERLAALEGGAAEIARDAVAAALTSADVGLTYDDTTGKMTLTTNPVALGPAYVDAEVKPLAPTEVEQGGWIYQIGWHAEDRLCDEEEHEWDSVHSMAGLQFEVCSTCAVKRRPVPGNIPIIDPDDGEHLGMYRPKTGERFWGIP